MTNQRNESTLSVVARAAFSCLLGAVVGIGVAAIVEVHTGSELELGQILLIVLISTGIATIVSLIVSSILGIRQNIVKK